MSTPSHANFPPPLLSVNGFQQRLAAQEQYEAGARKGCESYRQVTGDYHDFQVVGSHLANPETSDDDPRRVDNFLAHRLQESLGRATRPVIMLDIGGEFGITAYKLAAAFGDAIDEGSLVIGVTNLAEKSVFEREHEELVDDRQRYNDILEIRAEAGGRVQEISSNGRELANKSISMADGTEIPLKGNVTLAHERHAFTFWSQVPGVDIWGASRIVADDGLYMTLAANSEKPFTERSPWDQDSTKQRRQEIALAHDLLADEQRLTVNRTVKIGKFANETMHYLMFTGPSALPIDI